MSCLAFEGRDSTKGYRGVDGNKLLGQEARAPFLRVCRRPESQRGCRGLYQEGPAWVNSFSSHFTPEPQHSVCGGGAWPTSTLFFS